MKRVTILRLIVGVMFVADVVSAQDVRKALEELQQAYKSAENLRISMSINAYESRGSQRPFYHEKAIIKKQGIVYRYSLAQMEMVMNEKYIIAVDHSSHQIMINSRDVKKEAGFQKQVPLNMDSIFHLFDDARYEAVEDGSSKYVITQKTGEIKEIEFFVQQKLNRLSKINYLYKEGQWVTITFDEFDLSASFNISEFNEDQFVRKAGKKWQPAASFTGYQVVVPDTN
jgi:outer membrane lipoprotein-sorting protein